MSGRASLIIANSDVVSDENPLPVKTGGGLPGAGGWTEASKTVAATGTPEALGGDVDFRELLIFELTTNTGEVNWGAASGNGTQHGTLPVQLTNGNLQEIYLDVAVNGEGVRYLYR